MERHRPSGIVGGCLGMAAKSRQRRRWFLKEWREYRDLSQERLADRVGVTQGLISQLENNRVNYTSDLLEKLADALLCEPADLLIRNPMDAEAPWSIWDTLPKPARVQAIEILKALKRTSTG